MKRKYTTITIPTPLFEKLQAMIKGTGFSSVSDCATYILRETVSEMAGHGRGRRQSRKTIGSVLEKLESLGYTG
jgi:metal-responsive CopG/Arc/MetJ family transcriptional regulator